MSSYREKFIQAIAKTKEYGFDVPKCEFENEKYFTPQIPESFSMIFREVLPYEVDQTKCNCLKINFELFLKLDKIIPNGAFLTIGWIECGKKKQFFFDYNYIDTLLKGEKSKNVLRLHAWITLPTMEIIDLTFLTTYGSIFNEPDMIGNVIAKDADSLQGMSYIPMLVGSDIFKNITVTYIPTINLTDSCYQNPPSKIQEILDWFKKGFL